MIHLAHLSSPDPVAPQGSGFDLHLQKLPICLSFCSPGGGVGFERWGSTLDWIGGCD